MSALDGMAGLLPETAVVGKNGNLSVGGCDIVELAAEFGTPLYVFDEATLRQTCAEYRTAFARRYEDSLVIYAAKAFLNKALAVIVMEEGLGLDVVSGGELSISKSVGFPMDKVYFHGNNKSRDELELAISAGVGRIVIDNLHELPLVNEVAKRSGRTQEVLLRLTPGIDSHTHEHVTTGVIDSKFGLPLTTGQAEQAVVEAISASNLELVGLHVHLGSLIFSAEPYQKAIEVVFEFASEMRRRHRLQFQEFSPGGGFAIQYTRDAPAPGSDFFAGAIADAVLSSSERLSMDRPRLVVEPGRAIVGRAAVAVYRVGAIKDIPGVRRYVAVDGGMADNIRPALYGSRYEALVANKATLDGTETVTVAGKFCESGDILARDVKLSAVEPGDVLVIPAAGAYCLPLASNYNASPKPAIVLVNNGSARIIRQRETYDDLMRYDAV